MTLRSRLILALVALAAAGLAVFGIVTFELYQRSLVDQLDNQLEEFARPQAGRLTGLVAAGIVTDACTEPAFDRVGARRHPEGGFGPGQGLDAFSQLYVGGDLVGCIPPISGTGRPRVPLSVTTVDAARLTTVPGAVGGGSWRILATPVDQAVSPDASVSGNAVVVVAVRTAGIDESMRRLVHIEIATGMGLLAVLAFGAWLLLRRGLLPLEHMATGAATITAGDLSARVEPADAHTEVGQLGLALNTMLDGLESAFADRRATELRLRQFLADASHELRTPLTSIQGFAELYRLRDVAAVPDVPVIMGRIESEARRMRDLVEDLLLLAELDRVRPVRADPVDLSVLAADACTDAAAAAPGRRLVLTAPAPVVVHGDVDHLRQAIANLVANAIAHTPSGTPIEVSVDSRGAWAQITVADHGPGLDDDGLAHAFDRFWQADSARVGRGAGLGLSIVAGIAAEHGGRARVTSVQGHGARFSLELPVDGR